MAWSPQAPRLTLVKIVFHLQTQRIRKLKQIRYQLKQDAVLMQHSMRHFAILASGTVGDQVPAAICDLWPVRGRYPTVTARYIASALPGGKNGRSNDQRIK